MEVSELLKPRRKVIGHYPYSPYEIGDIIILAAAGTDLWDCVRNGRVINRLLIDPDLYPAIFKEMSWWQERRPEDLPQYIIRVDTKTYVQIYGQSIEVGKVIPFESRLGCTLDHFHPAIKTITPTPCPQ